MARKPAVPATVPAAIDPTVPYTEIVLDGVTYRMAATHRALAVAEDALVRQGHDVNLLLAKLRPSLSGIRAQFAASLYHYHPEIPFDAAQDLIDDGNLARVVMALDAAGAQAKPTADPTQPAGEAPKK